MVYCIVKNGVKREFVFAPMQILAKTWLYCVSKIVETIKNYLASIVRFQSYYFTPIISRKTPNRFYKLTILSIPIYWWSYTS